MRSSILAAFSVVLGLYGCAASPVVQPAKLRAATPAPPSASISGMTSNYLARYSIPDESAPAKTPGQTQNAPANQVAPVKAGQSVPPSSPDITTPQGLANALSADAQVEVTTWAEEELSIRLCNSSDDTAKHLIQTCATISNYMKEPYVSPDANDIQILQNAVRADLSNFVLMDLLQKGGAAKDLDNWRWVFYASLIQRAQTAGAQKAVAWIKDVPFIKAQCEPHASAAELCNLYLESVIIDTYLNAKDTTKCDDVRSAILDAVDPSVVASVNLTPCPTTAEVTAAATAGKAGTSTLRWLMSNTGAGSGAATLMQAAVAFDRLYSHTSAFGISTSFSDETYADGMATVLRSFDDFTGKHAKEDAVNIKLMFLIYSAAAAENYREVVYQLTESPDAKTLLDDIQTNDRDLYRVFLVAADVANAKTTDDLATTINSIAGPTGGYKYKAVTPDLLTLTGIVGLDYERDKVTGPGIDTTLPARGAFAPVGFEFSGPCEHASCGVLFSLVDVGNLINYSNSQTTTNGNVSGKPSSSFAQVESLGLYFARSFGSDSPFVWGFGASYTPSLRTATLINGRTQNLDARRFMIFIGVDVTLAPLKEDWH